MKALPEFRETDFQVYTDAISDYYTKYPADRQAGMPRVLEELAASHEINIDQIHDRLK